MSQAGRRPRHNPIADDGDELRFCSTCAFSDACLSQGYNKSDLMDLHVLVEHIGPFHEGEHIFREGDEFNAIAAVRAGTVKTYQIDRNGHEQVLGFHLPGEIIGLSAISQSRYPCNAVALDTVMLCRFSFPKMALLATRMPGLQAQLFRLLSQDIGKAALQAMKGAPTNRKKVTFEWNRDDVLKVIASNFEPGVPFKWIDFPQPNYASSSADMILDAAGKMVGMSMFNGYSYNERCLLSLGVVAQDVQEGDILTLLWGEPETTGKTSTEAHKQTEIRVRVAPTPYAAEARTNYADSWRTKS